LAIFPDSHLLRKYGEAVARDIQQQAKLYLTIFNISGNPKLNQAKLLAWDKELKQKQLNPGTSADLTVASLFAYGFTQLLEQSYS
jgi:triphosphoribosyl-dephospho-CoA synthase